jgi:hypothetical protein
VQKSTSGWLSLIVAILAIAQRLAGYENKPLAICLVAIAGMALVYFTTLSIKDGIGKALVIHRAIYGSDFGGLDVTDIVRGRVHDNRLNIKVGSGLFGDPCPNQFKHLTVEYSAGVLKHQTQVFQQDHWCNLP